MANLIYKQRDSFSLAGSLQEFLDLIFFREINYFDRTGTIDFGNNFINYYGDPSTIQPSGDFTFSDILEERIDELFRKVGNTKKLSIIFHDKLSACYTIHKINQRPEIDDMISQNRINIINKNNSLLFKSFVERLKIPESLYTGTCYDDDNTIYLIFSGGLNILDLTLPLNSEILDLDEFKNYFNNNIYFDQLQILIDKCPIPITNTYTYLWWLKNCLCKNYFESFPFADVVNNVKFETIFSIFNDDRFLQNSFYRLQTENIYSIIYSDYLYSKLIEFYPDILEFREYHYKSKVFLSLSNIKKTIYDDGTIE